MQDVASLDALLCIQDIFLVLGGFWQLVLYDGESSVQSTTIESTGRALTLFIPTPTTRGARNSCFLGSTQHRVSYRMALSAANATSSNGL